MDFLEKQQKLPRIIKNFFDSDSPRLELERSCFMYSIKDEDIQKISGPVGLIFVGDLQLETLPELIEKNLNIHAGMPYGLAYEINYRIFNRFPDYFKSSTLLLNKWQSLKSNPVISESEAWQKVLELEPWILEEKKEKTQERKIEEEKIKKYQSQLEKLPIDIAVKKYPEVGEQLITSDYIKLKSFFEPVRPSIKNWLSDYTFNIGISNHDPIVRGNYLFKNENARKLSQPDRDKLSQILKSFEEKTPLAVNTNTRQVVFSAMASQEKTQTFQTDEERLSAWRKNLPLLENKNNNQSGANNIRFSSPQTFSAEKTAVKNNFFAARPMPKNVVDLREE